MRLPYRNSRELATGPLAPVLAGRLLSLILALLALALVGLVPVLGGLIALAAIATGPGALAAQAYGRWAGA